MSETVVAKTRETLTAERADYAAAVCVALVEALIAGGLGANIPTELLEATAAVKADLVSG